MKQNGILSLSLIALGLVLCFFHVSILTTALRTIGIVLTLAGAFLVFLFFDKREMTDSSTLATAIPFCLFGLFLVISPKSLLSLLPIFSGLFIVFQSLVSIQKALVLKDLGFERWPWSLGIGILSLLIGLFFIIRPITSLEIILKWIGVWLIISGIVWLVESWLIQKYSED